MSVLALSGQMLWHRNLAALLFLVLLAAAFAAASLLETLPLPYEPVLLAECVATGVIAAYSLEAAAISAGALAVPPLVAALRRGAMQVVLSLSAELTAVVVTLAVAGRPFGQPEGGAVFIAVMAGLGFGLIITALKYDTRPEPDEAVAYRQARRLLRDLVDLSEGLNTGLDAGTQGAAILAKVRDRVPATELALHVPAGGGLRELLRLPAEGTDDADLAGKVWGDSRTLLDGQRFGFVLSTDAGPQAVVTGELSDRVAPDQIDLEAAIDALHTELGQASLALETALVFRSLQDRATARERQRLARDMHDGIAQEIASMGYLVDSLVTTAGNDQQRASLTLLRRHITSVVGEVRRTVTQLRSESTASDSLGAAVGSLARHLSARSGIPISVRVDERTERLSPEVEGELLRIAQEAMNNAVKHSGTDTIEVTCMVHAPSALLSVRDNGLGLQRARPDSYGLQIMRERAELIGASLTIQDSDTGVTVTAELPARPVG